MSPSNFSTSPSDTSSPSSSRLANFTVANSRKVCLNLYVTCLTRPHALLNRTSIAEDNLNISLKDITVTQRDGRVSQLDQVYIRGSMVRFFIVPDMLQNAPM